MVKILTYLKQNKKGQGLTEYVLILAFIAGVAFMIFGNGGLKATVSSTFNKTVELIASINEDDNRTPEEKAIAADYANLKSIGEKIKATFLINSNSIKEQRNGRYLVPGELSVIVLPDGTADILINDKSGYFNGDGRNRWSYWLSDLNSLEGFNPAQENERTNLNNLVKTELGIDFTSGTGKVDTSGLYKINSAGVESSAVRNGSAVSYVQTGNGQTGMVYTGITANVTKDNYKTELKNGDLITTQAGGPYGYRTDRVVKIDID